MLSTRTQTLLSKWFVHGRLRGIGRPLASFVIAQELAMQHLLDFLWPKIDKSDHALINTHLTAVIKTFERPEILMRLLSSIRRRYPSLHVMVVDDSRHPVKLDGVETIIMPYDSGISAGRNEALRHLKTKYLLILDDDFIFYRDTKLEEAMAIMERYPRIDIMGGKVVNLPFFNSIDYGKAGLFPTDAVSIMPAGSHVGGLPVYDKVANFFIGRTERLRLVGWDSLLKRLEHADFFTRAKGVLLTVYNENIKVLHAKTPFDTAYMKKRNDCAVEHALLRYRYYRKKGYQRHKTEGSLQSE